MSQAYLFVHFRAKTTPDGEQVYFAISRDCRHWESVNGGNPVLWAYYGDKGVRDFTVVRSVFDNRFYIFATDLSLSYGMRGKYHNSWDEISRNGSRYFSVWDSDDLVHWSEQRLQSIGNADFGCMWAPDIIYDINENNYVIHWSSPIDRDGSKHKAIYYSRTVDFKNFTEPQILYSREDCGVIDSAIYEENGRYYLFLKSEGNPTDICMLKSDHITGPYELMPEFNENMKCIYGGGYEAPTAVKAEDGKWYLFLDCYGEPIRRGSEQGYVPFVADSLESADFVRLNDEFYFPYGLKHGTILPVSEEEYERILSYNWDED